MADTESTFPRVTVEECGLPQRFAVVMGDAGEITFGCESVQEVFGVISGFYGAQRVLLESPISLITGALLGPSDPAFEAGFRLGEEARQVYE